MTDGTVLAYIPSPSQGVWHLGPVPIRAYALCIIVGIVVAVWWGSRRWQARGGQPGEVIDVALWAVPFGLIGGRIYHVLTDWETYFGPGGKGLGAAFQVWEGGLGIWGAVAFGALGAWIGARNMGIKLPPFGDAIAPAILLAQAIGRLGNYFNQELFGRPTEVPWGLEIFDRVNDQGQVSFKLIDGVSNGHVYAIVHPTFLYELIWNVLIVIALVLIDRRFQIGHGRLFAMYVAGYCVGRFGVELMRDDFATHIFGVRINVFTAAIVFLCAALYVVMAPKGREQGLTMYWPDRADELAEEGAVGYVTPEAAFDDDAEDDEYSDDDYGDHSEPDASEADDSEPDDWGAEDSEPDDWDDLSDEGGAAAAGAGAVAAAGLASDDDETDDDETDVVETDAEEQDVAETDIEDPDVAETDIEDPNIAASDVAEETGVDESEVELDGDSPDAPTDDETLEDETADDDAAADQTPVDQPDEDETGADEDSTDHAAAEEPAVDESVDTAEAPEAQRGRVIPGREPSIVDSVSSQGYTIVRADDEELSGISIVEQNPGGSAGSIEIRRSDSADSEPSESSDESRSGEGAEERDTPEEDS